MINVSTRSTACIHMPDVWCMPLTPLTCKPKTASKSAAGGRIKLRYTLGVYLKRHSCIFNLFLHKNTIWCMLHKEFSWKISTTFLQKRIIVITPAAMKNRVAITQVKRTHYGVDLRTEGETGRQTEIGMAVVEDRPNDERDRDSWPWAIAVPQPLITAL